MVRKGDALVRKTLSFLSLDQRSAQTDAPTKTAMLALRAWLLRLSRLLISEEIKSNQSVDVHGAKLLRRVVRVAQLGDQSKGIT